MIKFSEWKRQLEIVMSKRLGTEVPYDMELARNSWQEGESPEQFFNENLNDPEEVERFTARDFF